MEGQYLHVAVQAHKDLSSGTKRLWQSSIFLSTETHHFNTYIVQGGILSTCSFWETYRLTPIQTPLSFPFKWTNRIIFVMLILSPRRMCERQVQRVVLYSAHMFNQDEGFVDSNLTLCDLQICGRRGLCTGMRGKCLSLDVTKGSAGDLHFSISGGNSGTWLAEYDYRAWSRLLVWKTCVKKRALLLCWMQFFLFFFFQQNVLQEFNDSPELNTGQCIHSSSPSCPSSMKWRDKNVFSTLSSY